MILSCPHVHTFMCQKYWTTVRKNILNEWNKNQYKFCLGAMKSYRKKKLHGKPISCHCVLPVLIIWLLYFNAILFEKIVCAVSQSPPEAEHAVHCTITIKLGLKESPIVKNCFSHLTASWKLPCFLIKISEKIHIYILN